MFPATISGKPVSVLDEVRAAELLRPELDVESYLRLGLRCPVGVPVLSPSPSIHSHSARAWPRMGNWMRYLACESVEVEFVALDGERTLRDVLPHCE